MSKFLFFILLTLSFPLKSYGDEFDDFLKNSGAGSQNQEVMLPPTPLTKKTEEKEEKFTKNILLNFKDWVVISANPKGNKMCYSVINAKKRIGNISLPESNELKAYFMVHYFSAYKQRVSVFFDYKLRKGSRVFLSIDGTQFELKPFESYAFADSGEVDAKIISLLLTANKILIRGEGEGNVYSVDEYEANGFTKAYTEMKEKCGGLII